MVGFFAGEYSYIFVLFFIMIILLVVALHYDLLSNWRTAPMVALIGGLTLFWLHPGAFTNITIV